MLGHVMIERDYFFIGLLVFFILPVVPLKTIYKIQIAALCYIRAKLEERWPVVPLPGSKPLK